MFVKLCPWRFHWHFTPFFIIQRNDSQTWKQLKSAICGRLYQLHQLFTTRCCYSIDVLISRWMDVKLRGGGGQASVISVSGNKESKQNRDRTITRTAARPGEDGLLLVFAVGPCSSGPGPCLSSSSLRLPGGQVCVGSVSSLAETLRTGRVDWERSHCLRTLDGGLPKLIDAKSEQSQVCLTRSWSYVW